MDLLGFSAIGHVSVVDVTQSNTINDLLHYWP